MIHLLIELVNFLYGGVAIGLLNRFELFVILSVVTASNLIPYLRARGETLGIDNKVGIAARPERVIFAVIYMLFEYLFIVFIYLHSYCGLLCIKDSLSYITISNENFTIFFISLSHKY